MNAPRQSDPTGPEPSDLRLGLIEERLAGIREHAATKADLAAVQAEVKALLAAMHAEVKALGVTVRDIQERGATKADLAAVHAEVKALSAIVRVI